MLFHTPSSAEVAGYAVLPFSKHSATFSIIEDVLTRTRSTNSSRERPRAFVRQLGEQ
jgi:hypothetical protein